MSTGKVTENILMRRIDVYGLVSPTKAKNVVCCYFRKYDIKKIKEEYGVNTSLELDQHVGGPMQVPHLDECWWSDTRTSSW